MHLPYVHELHWQFSVRIEVIFYGAKLIFYPNKRSSVGLISFNSYFCEHVLQDPIDQVHLVDIVLIFRNVFLYTQVDMNKQSSLKSI